MCVLILYRTELVDSIAAQALLRIEHLHSHGYIHKDQGNQTWSLFAFRTLILSMYMHCCLIVVLFSLIILLLVRKMVQFSDMILELLKILMNLEIILPTFPLFAAPQPLIQQPLPQQPLFCTYQPIAAMRISTFTQETTLQNNKKKKPKKQQPKQQKN